MKTVKTLTAGLLFAPMLAIGSTGHGPSGQTANQMDYQPLQVAQRARHADARSSDHFIAQALANMVSIDNLMGSPVHTTDDEEVGNINDIVVDVDGQIKAIIVGVGGFLGIGEKDVAITWDNVNVVPKSDSARAEISPDEFKVRVTVTEDQLRDAPEFDRSW